LNDDGATHSGIYCFLNGVNNGFSSALVSDPVTSDVGTLLNQWANYSASNTVNGIQFKGVPDGIYNLVVYGIDSTWNDRGIVVTVHDSVSGDQTANTENDTATSGVLSPLAQGVNFVLFNSVHVSGGTLSADIAANPGITSHPGNSEVEFNGAQLQLVSLTAPAPTITLTNTFSGASLSLNWSQGILQTATNVLGPWGSIYAPAPVTVTTTNAAQFYRVQVQ
jgi:hypothetical protein